MLLMCMSIAGTVPLIICLLLLLSPKEKVFIPAWPEPGVSESGGVFDTVSGG